MSVASQRPHLHPLLWAAGLSVTPSAWWASPPSPVCCRNGTQRPPPSRPPWPPRWQKPVAQPVPPPVAATPKPSVQRKAAPRTNSPLQKGGPPQQR